MATHSGTSNTHMPTRVSNSSVQLPEKLGLSASAERSTSMLCRRRGRVSSSRLLHFLCGKQISRVRKRHYLRLIIDNRLNWRPAVLEPIAAGRRVLSILRKLCGQNWGGLPSSQLLLYRGFVVSWSLYSLPLLSLSLLHNGNGLRPCIVWASNNV